MPYRSLRAGGRTLQIRSTMLFGWDGAGTADNACPCTHRDHAFGSEEGTDLGGSVCYPYPISGRFGNTLLPRHTFCPI